MPLYRHPPPQPSQRSRRVIPAEPIQAITGSGGGTSAVATATGSGTSIQNVTGTGDAVLAPQSASGGGTSLLTFTGTGAGEQAAATAAGIGVELITGSGDSSPPPASAAGTGTSIQNVTGTGAGAGAASTAVGSGTSLLAPTTGTGAGTQTAQASSGAGSSLLAPVTGTGAGTQAAATANGSGSHTLGGVTGTGAGAAAAASSSGSGIESIGGTGAGTQAAPSGAGGGAPPAAVTGSGAGAGAAGSGSGGGGLAVGTGEGIATPIYDWVYAETTYDLLIEPDTYGESGGEAAFVIPDTGAGVQIPQSAVGAGTVWEAVTGTGAGTQVPQSAVGLGSAGGTSVIGIGAGTQVAQSGSGTGTHVGQPVTGTGAGTQVAQSAVGSGFSAMSTPVTGTGVGTQVPQGASGAGLMAPPVTGTGAGTQPAGHGYGSGLALLVPAPGAPTAIVIRINGVEVGDIVRYSDAMFVSQVNGTAGTCQFAVRDLGHDQAYVYGQTITLEIDGVLRWSGYLQRNTRQYSAEVVDTTDPQATARWFLIEGSDVNILFSRRITHDPVRPKSFLALSPPPSRRDSVHPDQWEEDSPSDEIVKYVITHYTELLSDGVGLGGVTNVGTPNPDWSAAFAASLTVGDFMREVNRLLGGVFYLTPDKTLVHKQVETATTTKYLSDYDDGNPDRIGVRDYSFVSDATAMVNDVHVWGTAAGVSTVAHAHAEDAASIAAHGRLQGGEFNMSMYKQASLDQRAEALVYGNDVTRHGAKDDRITCTATVFVPDFFLGDVVTCKSHVYEDSGQGLPFESDDVLTAVLPVRRITITFPTPTDVRYDLLLTQELDQPWSIYEYRFPKIKKPKGGGITDPPPIPLPPEIGDPGPGVCDCGITDTFDGRTTLPGTGLGTSTSGLLWTGGDYTADGVGHLSATVNSLAGLPVATPFRARWVMTRDGAHYGAFRMSLVSPNNSCNIFFDLNIAGDFQYGIVRATILNFASPGSPTVIGPVVSIPSIDAHCNVAVEVDNDTIRCKLWNIGDAEPGSWTVSLSRGVDTPTMTLIGPGWDGAGFLIDNLDVEGVDRCGKAQFEDFNRTLASSWGLATPSGYAWTNVGSSGSVAVSGGYGTLSVSNTLTFCQMRSPSLATVASGDRTMTAQLRFSSVTNGGNAFVGTWLAKIDDIGNGTLGVNSPYVLLEARAVAGSGRPVGRNLVMFDHDGVSSYIPVSITVNTFYTLKWKTNNATGSYGVKFYAAGTPEPSSWDIETAVAPFAAGPPQLNIQAVWASTGSGITSFDFIDFDYDGRPCFGTCGGVTHVIHDDFNRTTSNGWGTVAASSSPGTLFPTWGVTNANGFTNGSAGVLHGERPSQPIMTTSLDYPTPMTGTVMNLKATCSRALTNADRIQIFTGSVAPSLILQRTATGGLVLDGPGGSATVANALTMTTEWNVEFIGNAGGVIDMKVWNTSGFKPGSPTLQIPVTSGERFDRIDFRVEVASGSAALDLLVTDLTVSGQPCQPCIDYFDDFDDRTIALTNSHTGWGMPSSGVEAYSDQSLDFWTDPPGSGNNVIEIGVDDGVGQIRASLCDGTSFNFYANIINFRGYWFDNWVTVQPAAVSLPIIYEMRFRMNGHIPEDFVTPFPDTGAWTLQLVWVTTDNTTLEIGIASRTPRNPDGSDQTDWDASGAGGYVTIYGGPGGGWGGAGAAYRTKTDWQADVWYHVRVEAGLTTSRAWLWEEGDSIGTPLTGTHTSSFSRGLNELVFNSCSHAYPSWGVGSGQLDDFSGLPVGSWPTISIDVDNFGWSAPFALGDGCPDPGLIGGEATPGIPLSGVVWETLSHSGGSDFATTRAWVGPIQIWVNGALTIGYTATPAAGQFHLPSSISAADVLRVRYVANGNPI